MVVGIAITQNQLGSMDQGVIYTLSDGKGPVSLSAHCLEFCMVHITGGSMDDMPKIQASYHQCMTP